MTKPNNRHRVEALLVDGDEVYREQVRDEARLRRIREDIEDDAPWTKEVAKDIEHFEASEAQKQEGAND